MLRKLIGGLSLVGALASGAAAQSPFQQNFTWLNQTTNWGESGSGPDHNAGEFNNSGVNNLGKTGETAGVAFQIWCVDPMQYVGPGATTFEAWVTPLDQGDMSHTESGVNQSSNGSFAHTTPLSAATAILDYQKAAYLATQMTTANEYAYREAMWYLMGYTGTGYSNFAAAKSLGDGVTAGQVATIDLKQWAVISDVTDGKQEFLYKRETGSFLQVTPEPGTISLLAMGLVGMSGSALRRRRRKTKI